MYEAYHIAGKNLSFMQISIPLTGFRFVYVSPHLGEAHSPPAHGGLPYPWVCLIRPMASFTRHPIRRSRE